MRWVDAIPEADRFDVFNDASRSIWHRLPATRGTFQCDAGLLLAVPASTAAAFTPGYTATLTLTLA